MPGFDKTGPLAGSPATGRGRGLCTGWFQRVGAFFPQAVSWARRPYDCPRLGLGLRRGWGGRGRR